MDSSNEKTRKHHIFGHGRDKTASKPGLSSQPQPEALQPYGFPTPTHYPAHSHSHTPSHSPTHSHWPRVNNPVGPPRAPPNNRMSGPKNTIQFNRIDGSSNQDPKENKKVEDSKTGAKNDKKKGSGCVIQ
ncbi:hypothetical protein D9619_007976 [Psilocybe cf. subviscida]|uniref:Uncharacterized protein n=1 Tax=Psilocybe cf. subviscida TaxID=2480587 RepID=A0A8H5ESC2_9AGAR|nr:hypothetical protein D9619_007976 [Psilocybe cf. subviscida]